MLTNDAIEFRRLIEKTRLFRRDIAEYLGVKERVIYKWQAGDRPVPKSVMIALKVLAEEL